MSARAWLRTACGLTAVLGVGHVFGSPWTPAADEPGRAIVAAMRGYHFPAAGFERSYFDFYQGFGWMLAIYLAGHAVLLWLLSAQTAQPPRALRSIIAVLTMEALLLAVVATVYLFWVPLALSFAIALCLAAAALSLPAPGHAASNRAPV